MGNSSSKPPDSAHQSSPHNATTPKSSALSSKSSISRRHAEAPARERSTSAGQAPKHASSSTRATIDAPSTSEGRGGESQGKGQRKNREGKVVHESHQIAPHKENVRQKGPDTAFDSSAQHRDPGFVQHSNFGLPPRLPLPIGEEIHSPGSPIIDAQGSSLLHEDAAERESLPRPISAVSNTTADDDELGDELRPFEAEYSKHAIPTTVYWRQGGEKVYVTGTFTGWSRKYRMERDAAGDFLSTTLQLPAGTHHIKFIVDGDMQLSNDLPTAVDYTNILVNYIEVSAGEIREDVNLAQNTPLPHIAEEASVTPEQTVERGASAGLTESSALYLQRAQWGRELPRYLVDVDEPESSNKYQRSSRAIEEFPAPPTLPLLLGKSILNGTLPMKDDNSVLNMPSHTVLNHLATSSIKNDVLATSITTRYNRKYVTTVVYKPTD